MSIIVENISKFYGKQLALDNVSFSISSGEVVGFLGPNGAGKSTMMKILTGYIPQTSGNAKVCDINVDAGTQQFRQKVGYLPEHNPLYLDMYVREYLEYVANIYSVTNKNRRIELMVEQTGLGNEAHKKIGSLSKGYRQRVGLAQALLPNPDVLILDEPTTGLDPNQIVEVRNLIKEVGREKTIMLSTHIMQEVSAICERVIIINNGKIVADDQTAHLSEISKKNRTVVTVEFLAPLDIQLLKQFPDVANVKQMSNQKFALSVESQKDIRPDLFHWSVKNNQVIIEMHQEEKSLESVFRELTV